MAAHFFGDREWIQIEPAQLDWLRDEAAATPRRRARFCLHTDLSDPVQEMLIALCADSYLPPLRQVGREKSFHVLSGELAVVFFDGPDRVLRRARLGGPGRAVSARFQAGVWHTTIAVGGPAVYLEVMPGPFSEGTTEYAPWAPGPDEREAGLAWLAARG